MEFKSEQKYLILSPRKIRPVVDVIKKMTPIKALEKLPFIKRRASEFILKVIKSALANANQKGVNTEDLIFKEIQIGEGPRLKRGQSVSRGRWHPIKKRMSHIKVVLVTKKETKKVETKVNKQSLPLRGKKTVEIQPKGYKKVIGKEKKNGTKS